MVSNAVESPLAQETALRLALGHNPWIAEPRVQLAQLYFRAGRYVEAAEESRIALECFYTWASCWDKRLPFRQWVAFTRMMFLRSSRRAQGHATSLVHSAEHANFHHGPLASLKQLVSGMQ